MCWTAKKKKKIVTRTIAKFEFLNANFIHQKKIRHSSFIYNGTNKTLYYKILRIVALPPTNTQCYWRTFIVFSSKQYNKRKLLFIYVDLQQYRSRSRDRPNTVLNMFISYTIEYQISDGKLLRNLSRFWSFSKLKRKVGLF